jgi:hypothetical protein
VELNNCAPLLANNDWIGIYQEENVIVVDDSSDTMNNSNAIARGRTCSVVLGL